MSKDRSSLKKLKGWLRGHSKSSPSSRTVRATPSPVPKVTGTASLPLESVSGMVLHLSEDIIDALSQQHWHRGPNGKSRMTS